VNRQIDLAVEKRPFDLLDENPDARRGAAFAPANRSPSVVIFTNARFCPSASRGLRDELTISTCATESGFLALRVAPYRVSSSSSMNRSRNRVEPQQPDMGAAIAQLDLRKGVLKEAPEEKLEKWSILRICSSSKRGRILSSSSARMASIFPSSFTTRIEP